MRFLITGGAGFIGSNLAHRLLARGEQVTIFDNLHRSSSRHNIDWLRTDFGGAFDVIRADIRDAAALARAMLDVDVAVHLAGQVAVTASVANPREDFEINALGTINILEAVRMAADPPILLYASTNKVYGRMQEVGVVEDDLRYRYPELEGIAETQPLDFHSPYGCSKGAADQYVRDYARIYGLRTVVFRQSCIYGPRQFGVEDQGWVAHFLISARLGRPISIYGDGKQVRDLLHVDDLVDAYVKAVERIDVASGEIYNLGGGSRNALSVWTEFGRLMEKLAGREIPVTFHDWRPGDQLVCIMDNSKAERELGWTCRVGAAEGIERLWHWVGENRLLFEAMP